MKKKAGFEFAIGERVFMLGRAGLCVVTGTGIMNFMSGGKLNMYQIQGAMSGYVMELELLTEKEGRELYAVPRVRS